jgi:ribulose-phosphate 3-epimerase
MVYKIAPSLLSADMAFLGDEVKKVMQAGADMVHFDVMDNHYVPNLTFGPAVCRSLIKHFPDLIVDVHLMVMPVDNLIEAFADAGAKRIAIHPDATIHLDRSLQLIKSHHCQAGLVLNPATSIDCVRWCHHRLDYLLIMTVNPGFGGQQLIPEMLSKIRELREKYPTLPICVDGGVNAKNIAELAKAGADQFVAGSAIFKSGDYNKVITMMRKNLSQ